MKSLLRPWWIFRLLSMVGLCVVAFRPSITGPHPHQNHPWAVLLDTSASMKTKDPLSRFDQAKSLLADLKPLAQGEIYSFSSDVQRIPTAEWQELVSTGTKTNLAQAMEAVGKGRNVKGILVLTDGRQVGGGDVISVAAAMGKPLVLVGFGDKSHFKDVAVKSIQSAPFAFKNISTSLSAVVSASGFKGTQVTVRLKQGDEILSLQTLAVTETEMEASVVFQWTPKNLGAHTLSVEIAALPGEITTSNNRKRVTMDVGRDRFRVLYICGEPGPEYGFLRYQFKSDPAVELVTFVILRNNQNILTVPENELSLIPFPTQDILINQLPTFDLIVFDEFLYPNFGLLPSVVMAIRQKVQDGGSFLLVGGPNTFGPGSPYNISGIHEMLPVTLGSPQTKLEPSPLLMKIRAPLHPIMRLDSNPEKNQVVWASLPGLDDVTLLPQAKDGSTVLLGAQYQGQDHPVLTVWKYGKGRVGALTARTTYRWSMQKGGGQFSSDVYSQFWKNVVLWLTHSDKYKSLRLSMARKEIPLGETETLRLWVTDDYFKPVSDADIRIQLQTPDGKKSSLTAQEESRGVYAVVLNAEQQGTYIVESWATRQGRRVGEEKLSFAVISENMEEDDLRPDYDLMKELAQISNGRSLRFDEFSVKLMEEFDQDLTQRGGRKIFIWNSPWLFGWIVLFLILEWVVRKKRGLP